MSKIYLGKGFVNFKKLDDVIRSNADDCRCQKSNILTFKFFPSVWFTN